MEFIKDNYLKGSGNGPTWHVDIDPPKRKIKTYFEETCLAAEYMYSYKLGRLYLLFSGGMDSQYVFHVFKRLKFNFTPVIIRLQGKYYDIDYNAHESVYAFEYCKQHAIEPLVMKFDFDKFVDNGEIFEICNEVKCGSHHLAACMKISTMLDGFMVQGNDPPYMKYDTKNEKWKLEEMEVIHSILNFHKIKNVPGCPFLLSYTAEMMLSFLTDPHMVSLANGKYPGKLGTNSGKAYVFNRNSDFNMHPYNFITKSRVKSTGYEIIDSSELMNCPNMLEYQQYRKKWCGVYYEDWHTVVERLSINQ